MTLLKTNVFSNLIRENINVKETYKFNFLIITKMYYRNLYQIPLQQIKDQIKFWSFITII